MSKPSLTEQRRHGKQIAVKYLVALLGAFLVSLIYIAALGVNPLTAYAEMITGAFGKKSSVFEILAKATPYAIMGLGISAAVKGGMSNLGGDGQFYVGAICAICVGLYLPQNLPAPLIWVLAALVAIAAGGVWGGAAGLLKAKFQTNEVIITIMLNYVGQYLVSWLVSGPPEAPGGIPQTRALSQAYYLPKLMTGSRAHWGIVLVVVLAVLVAFVFRKTTLGYKIEAVGAAPEAAVYSGINKRLYTVLILFGSGAFCGLAGMVEVYGTYYRVMEGITTSFGFTAMLIALLAQLNPVAVILGSLEQGDGLKVAAHLLQSCQGLLLVLLQLQLGAVQGLAPLGPQSP